MTCPVCGGKSVVIDSRRYPDYVRRRRECAECGERFTTVELDADLYKRMAEKAERGNA